MKQAAWVIPSFIEGSGGYRTIFQYINYMSKEFACDVYVYDSGDYRMDTEIAKRAEKLYGKCRCRFILGHEIPTDKSYNAVIATSWLTADIVYRYQGEGKKIYFVQDYEPMFYPAGSEYLKAASTYELGLSHITIGRWLAHRLMENHEAEVSYFDFGIDKLTYCYDKEKKRENAVCFIYQPDKPRRCTQMGLDALELVKKLRPDIKIYLYGSLKKNKLSFEHTNMGLLTPADCAKLYNKCLVGLCISASNPSRIPFEMMACGLPVVDIYAENNMYDYQDGVIVLSPCRAEALAQAVISLIDDKQKRDMIRDNGLRFIDKRSMDGEAQCFMELTNSLIQSSRTGQEMPEKTFVGRTEPLVQYIEAEWMVLQSRRKKRVLDYLGHNYIIRRIPGIKSLGRLILNKRNG